MTLPHIDASGRWNAGKAAVVFPSGPRRDRTVAPEPPVSSKHTLGGPSAWLTRTLVTMTFSGWIVHE